MTHDLHMLAAKEAGYNDVKYDGMDLFHLLDCRCHVCRMYYDEGQEAAMKEIFEGRNMGENDVEDV